MGMDLRDLLARTAAGAPGVKAISLLGFDGIAVETLVAGAGDGAPEDTVVWELELADLMKAARRVTHRLGWAPASDIVLEAGDLTLLARPVSADYFLMLVLDSAANVTRAGYELRQAAALLADTP